MVVKNERGQPTTGAVVTFNISEGAGTLSALSDTTNSSGIARTTLTLGDSFGKTQVTASVDSITPIIFTATVLPPTLVIAGGNNQVGFSEEEFKESLQGTINKS